MTISMQEKEINVKDIAEKMGEDLLVDFVHAFATKVSDEEKSALVDYLIQSAADINNMSIGKHMLIHLNLFCSVLYKTPEGSGKDNFIDDAVNILEGMKSAKAKAKH